jgi:hypothetical protein
MKAGNLDKQAGEERELTSVAAEEPQMTPVPGDVYLCQVNENLSCGACCGLYNCANASRGHLEAQLIDRTERFRDVPRDPDAITDFQVKEERRDPRPRPYPDFYHCPFLGLVGENGSRVGCLLHPLAKGNAGIDYRGLSFYGGLACRDYFCPTYRHLSRNYKDIVRAVCRDWYLYGLVVTEDRLLAAFFNAIEDRLGRSLTAADITQRPAAGRSILDFLELKLDWPYRHVGWHGPGNYFFNDGQYPKPPIDYAHLGAPPSRYDAILHELSSAFNYPNELAQAETLIEDTLERILRAVD